VIYGFSEPRPQTAPAKATGGRQDYHDFEVPFKSIQVSASACITGVNWLNTSIWSFFIPDRPIFMAGAVFRDTGILHLSVWDLVCIYLRFQIACVTVFIILTLLALGRRGIY